MPNYQMDEINVNLKNHSMDQTLSDLRRFQGRTGKLSAEELAKLRKAAQGFEAIFVAQILKNMRKSIPQSNLFGKGLAGEFYTGMFDDSIAKSIASKGGLHLADTIMESLLNTQGGATDKTLADYQLRPIRNKNLPSRSRDWDRSIIGEAAKQNNLDPTLVAAMIKVESDNDPDITSDKGAAGLMQLMKKTAESLGVTDRYNPRQNVFGGAKYLRKMLDRFHGNLELALAAYNAGPAAVEKFNGVPPFKETQRYVEKVLNKYMAM